MAYSQKRMPNDEAGFPTPPLWLVWFSDYKIEYKLDADGGYERDANGRVQILSEGVLPNGQVRHLATLQKCKNQVRGPEGFMRDWAIYHWEEVDGEPRYVKKHEGFRDQPVKTHPLFAKGAVKDGTQGRPRDPLQAEVDEAVATIHAVLGVTQ